MKKLITISIAALALAGCNSEEGTKKSADSEILVKAITVYDYSGQSATCTKNTISKDGDLKVNYISNTKVFHSSLSTNKTCLDVDSNNVDTISEYEYKDDFRSNIKRNYVNTVLDSCETTIVNNLNNRTKKTNKVAAVGNDCSGQPLWSYDRELNSDGVVKSFVYSSYGLDRKYMTTINTTSSSINTPSGSMDDVLVMNFNVSKTGFEDSNEYIFVNQFPINPSLLDVGSYTLVTNLDSSGTPTSGNLRKGNRIETCFEKKGLKITVYSPDYETESCEGLYSTHQPKIIINL